LNTLALKDTKSLPGYSSLYNGMPVVLHDKNASTDLKLTNGAQGYIRKITTSICPSNFTYATSVIVEFPGSPVHLPGLPKGFFPIEPTNWTFSTELELQPGIKTKVRVTCHQLPIQPAFAVTGHSAQGKTLPKVLVNLKEGGFPAYVAGSRETSREGLCITDPVTLQDLNKPLPHSLVVEARKFEAIEWNTEIEHGFCQGSPK
jgi:hypothetical protein